MGCRGQIKIEETGVFLYTHWGAKTLANDLRNILKLDIAQNRIDDPEYLTRIIFSNLIKKDINGECNFGIGTSEIGDIEILITLDARNDVISIEDFRVGKTIIYDTINDFIEDIEDEE